MWKVTEPGVVLLFRRICEGMEFVPAGINPLIPGVAVAVHTKEVPPTFDVKVTGVLGFPEQTV